MSEIPSRVPLVDAYATIVPEVGAAFKKMHPKGKALFHKLKEHDPKTALHSLAVATLCTQAAIELDSPPDVVEKVAQASTIHCVGKEGVSKETINWKGKYTPEQWEEMRRHVLLGYYEILQFDPWIAAAMLTHHNRFQDSDNQYPSRDETQALDGEITLDPYLIRTRKHIAMFDSMEALTDPTRSYKDASPIEDTRRRMYLLEPDEGELIEFGIHILTSQAPQLEEMRMQFLKP